MDDKLIVDTSFKATIKVPASKVDIPKWAFSLSNKDYQDCSPAHVAAGSNLAADGKRMSINVEVIGGSFMVQHYVEDLAKKDHLRLNSISDVFTPMGRTTIQVVWELSVKTIDDNSCEFTNRVHTYATDDLISFLGRQGIPIDVFKSQRQAISAGHNQQETPFFAASIERAALQNK